MFCYKQKDFYIEFRDLRYFIDLVESESYHATAQKNQVTQPAISAMVKRLEEECGVQLVFKKSSRAPLVITPAEQVLYKRAKKLVKEENLIKIEVKRANANNFRLGYSELAGKAWLASVITHLNQGRMLANIETKEENSHLLEQHLREGRFDVIVFSRLGDEPLPGIKTTPLQRYQYVLVVAEDSPLAQLDEIRIAQIKDTPLIMRHKRFLSRTSLDRLFAKTGFQPTKKLIVDNIDATLQLVRQGMGVSYLMDIAVENVPCVKAIPLVPSQRSYCYSSLGIRENFIPNEVQKQYLEILKKNQDLN